MTHPLRPSRVYAICQIAGWGAYGVLGASLSRAFGYGTPAVIATTLLGSLVGLIVTHLWRGVIRGRGLLAQPFSRLLPKLFAGVVVTGLVAWLLVWATGLYVTGAYSMKTSTPAILLATSSQWIIMILLWTAIYVGAQWFKRWRDSEIQRLRLEVLHRDAQLSALHAQIQPHFLFNAMNVLRALISEDPMRARDLVTELSDLMRYALRAGQQERVLLQEELEVIESYLRIEQARFEDRLTWRIDADPAVRQTQLPPMLLQMLVENAVKHGVATSEFGGEVAVSARRDGDGVRLVVTNPGRVSVNGGTRIGLANARGRLALIYGGRAALTLTERDGQVVAEVVLPAGDAR
jgi:sensor histidine kinase YesM